jgi:uncharacterized membrane protein YccF (DUF307 family)
MVHFRRIYDILPLFTRKPGAVYYNYWHPFGLQTLKLSALSLAPFNKEVEHGERSGDMLFVIMNIFWTSRTGIANCSLIPWGSLRFNYNVDASGTSTLQANESSFGTVWI